MQFIKYLTIETNGDMSLSDEVPPEEAGGVTYQLLVIVPKSWNTMFFNHTDDWVVDITRHDDEESPVVGNIVLTPPDETPIVTHRRTTAK